MRNVSAKFLRDFLNGKKMLLKINEVVRVQKVWGFRETTTEKLIESYPDKFNALRYIPDISHYHKLDKEYVCNVSWPGFKYD